jgi:2-hydroxychromene-2-carboxylate isomerase
LSLTSLLMPAISQRLLSRERLLAQRSSAERARRQRGERHQLHYFHQVDDPYSALLAGQLLTLLARYDVDIEPHVVPPPTDAAAPERARLTDYSRRDAQRLSRRFGLGFTDLLAQPDSQALQRATALLVGAVADGRFFELAGPLSAGLWQDATTAATDRPAVSPAHLASETEVANHLKASSTLRERWGHYLGATLYYGGEWYWGLDRLHHLERRLQQLGAARPGVGDLMFPPGDDWQKARQGLSPAPIDFFFSLRSPYSAIVAPRVFALGRSSGAPVRLRYVLPMVMRGLPVPRSKRAYIALDAAREAFVRGIPFGRLNDPVGRPTERGLALMPLAERLGKAEDYVLSFMHGVWAQGLDAGSDRGLKTIAERAGLPWDQAKEALQDEAWRATAEANRQALFDLGLWGVPSFRVHDTAVWGQDRLWALQDALLAGATADATQNS